MLVTTVLPQAWPALHRADGVMLLALQTTISSGDSSRDLAAALLEAIDAEPGTAIELTGLPEAGPRLQDVLDLSVPFEVTVQDSFAYWLAPDVERTDDLAAAIEEADAGIIDTRKLAGVDSAYWCRMGAREFLRWAQPHEEQVVLDGLARLHAQARVRLRGREVRRLLPLERARRPRVGAAARHRGRGHRGRRRRVRARRSPRRCPAPSRSTPTSAARAPGLVARQVTLR